MILMRRSTTRHGLARCDVIVVAVIALLLAALTIPAVARSRTLGFGATSHANLATLGVAHAIYAAEWNGRQPTFVVDDIGAYGNGLSAFLWWNEMHEAPHPPITLGWGLSADGQGPPALYSFPTDGNLANASLTLPINFSISGSTSYFGAFRIPNTRQFRQYVSTKFYSAPFYAPADPVVHPLVEPLFDEPWEFVSQPPGSFGAIPFWSSYCFSPAAMVHPDVMGAGERDGEDDGAWINPWLLNHGYESPSFFAARYATLKTLMIEHHWLQDAPMDPCNPGFEGGIYDGCEPYYFNHGMASAPASLFYDLSVRILPNTEVKAADERILQKTGRGLWMRDTVFGSNGYFNDLSYDDVGLSHHVLTQNGILGRDTTAEQ